MSLQIYLQIFYFFFDVLVLVLLIFDRKDVAVELDAPRVLLQELLLLLLQYVPEGCFAVEQRGQALFLLRALRRVASLQGLLCMLAAKLRQVQFEALVLCLALLGGVLIKVAFIFDCHLLALAGFTRVLVVLFSL